MNNFIKLQRSELGQKTAQFSGEGAYHGSTKIRVPNLTPSEKEMNPETIISNIVFLLREYKPYRFPDFLAKFPNLFEVKKLLPIPEHNEVKNEKVTFCWCPWEQALQEAGPLTRNVLQEMEPLLERTKKFIYVDSKVQYLDVGDLPVDSKLWHVDGSIAIRDYRAQVLGYQLLHDMKARLLGESFPTYLAYQSSNFCATQFLKEPVSILIPECIPSFDLLDQKIKDMNIEIQHQPVASIVKFNGLSLHRAVPASNSGWRLWVRCVETDREIHLNSSIIECYNTVFKTS